MHHLLVVMDERRGGEIAEHVHRIADPQGPAYAQALTRAQLRELVAPGKDAVEAVVDWFAQYDIEISPSDPPTPQLLLFQATPEQCATALGPAATRWFERKKSISADRIEWPIPREIAGYISQIRVWDGDVASLRFEGTEWLSGAKNVGGADEGPPPGPEDLGGLTPADVAEIYDFPAELTGAGECIALLMLSPPPALQDLLDFWAAHGIDRGEDGDVAFVNVGPPPTHQSALGALEGAMIAQWAGAMAPGARLVFYLVDPAAFDDPWVPYLAAVVEDEENAPTVACTSWLRSERNYYNAFGPSVISGLLNQCAAIGVTVIAASGDWGCFDSFPTQRGAGGVEIADTPWPHTVFPASEPLVLAVGGTMISHREPLTEVAWSGPLPPKLELAFRTFAGGGGFSAHVSMPEWQRKHLMMAPDHAQPRAFSRGPEYPAALAYGRGIPDVSFAAAGRAIQRPGDTALTCDGFQALIGGHWIDYAGGTSLGTPIWGAITARLNQSRAAAAGAPRPMGFSNPTYYALAKPYWKTPDADGPFRAIDLGSNDVEVRALTRNHKGTYNASIRRIPGYRAEAGWDPVTGLGVPRVRALAAAVTEMVKAEPA